MKRLLVCVSAMSAWLICCAGAAAAQKNVVLFVADDMGTIAGCYGNKVIKTPHLDRLAAEGTLFSRAFCTSASCSPSRSVILTGLQNHANGQYGLEHSYHKFTTLESVRSLPALLSAAGYRTCSIGKVHVGPKHLYPFDQYANDGTQGSHNTVRMAENARTFIEQDPKRPFFLYFCPADAHRNFGNDKQYPGVEEVKYETSQVEVPPYLPDQPEVREELAQYYQSISRLDQGLGRLMEALRGTGKLNDTLVIFLSDHGMPWPAAKTTVYDAGLRSPLVVRSPDQHQRGVRTNAMTSWVDILPTVLDYTGAAGPKYALHGKSFLPVLDQAEPEGWDEIYASHTFHEVTMYYPMRAIRTERYKYILNLAHELPFPFAQDLYGSQTWQGVLRRGDRSYGKRTVEAYTHRPRHELYDLQADPHESINLAGESQHRETLEQLQGQLRAWQKQTGDPWIVKYERE